MRRLKVRLFIAVQIAVLFPVPATGEEQNTIALAASDAHAFQAAADALRAAGRRIRNITHEERTLGELGPLSLGMLDVARPRFWPAALANDWKRGIEACKARAGKPPYNARNREAFLCGRELAAVLRQRWLEHENLKSVLVIEVNSTSKTTSIEGIAFNPGETSERRLQYREVLTDQISTQVGRLALELARGGGETHARMILRDLPQKPNDNGQLKEGEYQELPAVELPKACLEKKSPFPAALEITPSDAPLARTIANRWSRTVAGHPTTDRLRCRLTLLGSQMEVLGPNLKSYMSKLQCGAVGASSRSVALTAGAKSLHDSLSKKLIAELLALYCR